MAKIKLNERVLEDTFRVCMGCAYVADGVMIRSDASGTVADLRRALEARGLSATVITTCDIFGRQEQMRQKSVST